jgi:hypothetical protein
MKSRGPSSRRRLPTTLRRAHAAEPAAEQPSRRRYAYPLLHTKDVRVAPKHHPTPLSGGDRKALQKELGKARAMTTFLATQSAEVRAKAEPLLQQDDRMLCESWNERMWADGEPIDPSPTIDQAINGGFAWLEVRCARCKTPSDFDLAAMKHPLTTVVHDLAGRLRCWKCAKAGRRPAATLLQLVWQPRHPRSED